MLIPTVKRGLVKSVKTKKKVIEKYIDIVSMEEYADTGHCHCLSSKKVLYYVVSNTVDNNTVLEGTYMEVCCTVFVRIYH